MRFCVYFRKLNAITKRDVYPLPKIQDALDALGNSLDLSSGYWQIKVAPEDQEKTSFVTIDGTYEFNVMHFGLTNAPATFQRTMDVILAGLKWNSCLVYLDDIIVFAPDFDTHLARLQAIFIRLREANFTLKSNKCVFAVNTIKYLGYIVGSDGQSPDPALIEAIVDFRKPKTIKDIRSFVGMCSVFRKFVEGFSSIAEPIIRLTKKDYACENKIRWDIEQELAFVKLKESLVSAPVLAHYDPDLPIEVRVDASGLAIGGVLVQKHKDGWHPVAYMSKLLNDTQRKYSITEKECFSMVYAVEHFRPYLEQQEFVIVTDHCALCWLKTKDKLTPKLERWATTLQGFNYTVRYKSGKVHKDADCLSQNYFSLPVPELNETNLFAYANVEFGVTYVGELQRKDLAIENIRKELLAYISKGTELPLRLRKFTIINDRVYRICNSQLGKYYTIYVPRKLRAEVCYNNHDDPQVLLARYATVYYQLCKKLC